MVYARTDFQVYDCSVAFVLVTIFFNQIECNLQDKMKYKEDSIL